MAQEAPASTETPAPAEGEPKAPEAEPKAETAPQNGDAKTFDADYVKQLRSEAAASRKARQEAEAKITEYEDANKSELEKLTGKVTKAEQAKAEAEAKLVRFEVAKEKEIPAEAVDLLNGTTREELEASADKILALVKSRNNNTSPDFDGGAREPAPEPKSAEEAHNDFMMQLLGRPTNT